MEEREIELGTEYVEKFLTDNGFSKVKGKKLAYKNDKCEVLIKLTDTDAWYEVIFEYGLDVGRMISDSFNIYWLIGFLTYYDLMGKNYKQ